MKKLAFFVSLLFLITSCSNDLSEQSISTLLVLKNDVIVKQEYYNDHSESDLNNVQSITKSIVSLLVGVAIEEGYIESEEVFIHQFFPAEAHFDDEKKKSITIKHLLNHTSGLDWRGYLEHEAFMETSNPAQYVLTFYVVIQI